MPGTKASQRLAREQWSGGPSTGSQGGPTQQQHPQQQLLRRPWETPSTCGQASPHTWVVRALQRLSHGNTGGLHTGQLQLKNFLLGGEKKKKARNSFVLWRTQSGLQSVPKAQGKASSMTRPSVIDPARRNFGEPFFPLGAHLHKTTLELASQSKKANPCPKEPAILWNTLHCSTASSRLQIWLSAGTSSPSLSTHCTQLHCGKQLVLIQSLGVGGKNYLILGR